jgi:glycosyltransferase involved in cell wall biosynthesis
MARLRAPAVSVFMPVYNAARYVEAAVRSMLVQTLADFEFLVVDDGSEDSTVEIVQRLASEDRRITLFTQRHSGGSSAANAALAHARAPFLARMDGDDIALYERLARQATYLEEHPRCVLVGARVRCIDADGAILPDPPEIAVKLSHADIDTALLAAGWPIVHPTCLMRAAVVRRIGGYSNDFRISSDHDLFLRLAEEGQLHNLPNALLLYRRHAGSVQGNPSNAGLGGWYVQEAIRRARARRARAVALIKEPCSDYSVPR